MFGWFRPKCPIPSPEQLWIDRRMSWLARTFGADRLRQAPVVLPTPEFFPGPYQGTEDDVRRLFRRACRYLGIDPNRLDVGLFEPPHPAAPEAVGLYVPGKREKILLADTQVGDPVSAVATLAHELAHVLLLGDKRISPDEEDHEQVTDLLTVFLGFGVFGSNSVMRESYESTARWHWWSISKQGYLSERMYGYACALFAWAREESAPAWAGHLRPNVRAVFKQSLAYLDKTGDTRFRAEADGTGEADLGRRVAAWVEALRSPWPGERLDALEGLGGCGAAAASAVAAVMPALRDPDPYVQAEAARALGAFGPAAAPAVSDLLDAALREDNPDLRQAATTAVGQIGCAPELAVPHLLQVAKAADAGLRSAAAVALGRFGAAAVPRLVSLLQDVDETVTVEAALALGGLGPAAAGAVPELIRMLEGGEGDLPAACAAALGEIGPASPEVVPALRKALAHPDEEVGAEAAAALRRMAPEFAPPELTQPRQGKKKRKR
jgi:HEAT repeat protein